MHQFLYVLLEKNNPGDVDTGVSPLLTPSCTRQHYPSSFSSAGFSCCVLNYMTKDQISPTEMNLCFAENCNRGEPLDKFLEVHFQRKEKETSTL